MLSTFKETAVQTIKVEVRRLQETLAENLEIHKKEFEEAWAGYEDARRQAIIHLGNVSGACSHTSDDRAKIHHAYRKFTGLDRPQDHSQSYEQAIVAMEWETRKEIDLSINDFECYVRDNWKWKESFKTSHSNYSPSG